MNVATETGLELSDQLTLPELAKFLKSVGRTSAANRRLDDWKNSVESLSSKQVWTGNRFASR
jgi:hypothetical protein